MTESEMGLLHDRALTQATKAASAAESSADVADKYAFGHPSAESYMAAAAAWQSTAAAWSHVATITAVRHDPAPSSLLGTDIKPETLRATRNVRAWEIVDSLFADLADRSGFDLSAVDDASLEGWRNHWIRIILGEEV